MRENKIYEFVSDIILLTSSQRPCSKLTGHQNFSAASCGVFDPCGAGGLCPIRYTLLEYPVIQAPCGAGGLTSNKVCLHGSLLRGNKIRHNPVLILFSANQQCKRKSCGICRRN